MILRNRGAKTPLLSVDLTPARVALNLRERGAVFPCKWCSVAEIYTNGPIVFENMETTTPGIFACGNVVHVHDLVDYVSEEAAAAGEHAAAYIAGGGAAAGRTLPVRCENGVRYTVPTTIRPDCAGDTVTLRFRVGSVYKNKKIAVYRGTDCIYSRKRPVLAPGEMETVRLKAELLRGPGDAVTVTLEEG
mgnify:CR=1 FL=1